jgi:hypothetical protein
MVLIQNDAALFLTEAQVAEIMGVALNTLRNSRYTKSDHPPYVKLGQRVLYPSDRLYKWMNARVKKNWN